MHNARYVFRGHNYFAICSHRSGALLVWLWLRIPERCPATPRASRHTNFVSWGRVLHKHADSRDHEQHFGCDYLLEHDRITRYERLGNGLHDRHLT
jgi:hypothetical protein